MLQAAGTRLLLCCILFLYLIPFPSCKKDPYKIGFDLLPPSDTLNLRTTDSSAVIAWSVIQDSIRTDNMTVLMLGSILDPVFGLTTSTLYTQFALSNDNPDFGTNPVLDSLVLSLDYASIYGDTNTLQNLKIFELSEPLYYDSLYYSNQTKETYGILLANHTFKPSPKDSIRVMGVKVRPHLRINLSGMTHYLGNKLLTAPGSALVNTGAFVNFMKGLCIRSAPVYSSGALVSFDPKGLYTRMILYFHNQEEDSLRFDFPIVTSSAYFNHFDHNGYKEASPEVRNQVVYRDSTLGKQQVYIQGLGGIRTRIRLPNISGFADLGRIALNDALLIIKNSDPDTTFAPPAGLTLLRVDSTGKIAFLVDETAGAGYFGGTYDPKSRSYQFRITRHLQQIILGKGTNYDLLLQVNDPTRNLLVPNRLIGTGTAPDLPAAFSDRITLRIVYTKLY